MHRGVFEQSMDERAGRRRLEARVVVVEHGTGKSGRAGITLT